MVTQFEFVPVPIYVIINRSPFRYLSTPSLSLSDVASNLKWQSLEKRDDAWGARVETEGETIPEEAKGIFIPGGGIAKRFFVDW